MVGARSRCDTGASIVPVRMPGPEAISGTRAEPSKNDILYQRPRSPSISPWSDVNSTIVSPARPVRSSTSSSSPTRWSSSLTAARYPRLAQDACSGVSGSSSAWYISLRRMLCGSAWSRGITSTAGRPMSTPS